MWTEQHRAIAPRASLTERAWAWTFEQVAAVDAAVSRVATTLGACPIVAVDSATGHPPCEHPGTQGAGEHAAVAKAKRAWSPSWSRQRPRLRRIAAGWWSRTAAGRVRGRSARGRGRRRRSGETATATRCSRFVRQCRCTGAAPWPCRCPSPSTRAQPTCSSNSPPPSTEGRLGWVTSNLPFWCWGEDLPGDVVAAAMIDRLVHHTEVLTSPATPTGPARVVSSRQAEPQQPGLTDHPRGQNSMPRSVS